MFDIGFLEIVVIAVLGLLVLGPERLPGVIKQVASWLSKSRHFANSLKDEFEREANLSEMRETLKQQKSQLEQQFEQQSRQVENDLNVSLNKTDSSSDQHLDDAPAKESEAAK